MKKNIEQIKPWRCKKCLAIVYISFDLHSYVCHLYRDNKTLIKSSESLISAINAGAMLASNVQPMQDSAYPLADNRLKGLSPAWDINARGGAIIDKGHSEAMSLPLDYDCGKGGAKLPLANPVKENGF